ncbi:MAG: cyclic nucleotide-binding domain-containing protein [Pseudomonadota bacterium]
MMDFITNTYVIETIGWLAVAFKLATFQMNTMIKLRVLVIASSICFIVYAAVFQIWPLLVIELILAGMNAYRLYEIIALRRLVTHMTDDSEADYSAAIAYGKKREVSAGDVIFEKGDDVDSLYYLAEGLVEIEGANATVTAGNIFGEMAFFNSSAERSATVRAVEDTVVYEVNEKRFTRLQYEDPKFAMSVMRLVTQRLVANAAQPKTN